MEGGSGAIKREVVDLSALLERQLALDRALLEQRNQRLGKELTPGLTVIGGRCPAGKAVGNLLSNAALYSPEGAQVRVWCGLLDGRPALTVENTGAHISEDALPRLFEAFYREEGLPEPLHRRQRPGLYLVKMILDRHGASVPWRIRDGGAGHGAVSDKRCLWTSRRGCGRITGIRQLGGTPMEKAILLHGSGHRADSWRRQFPI